MVAKPLANHAAERDAAERRLRDAQAIQKIEHIVTEPGQRVRTRWNARLAVSADVIPKHSIVTRQLVGLHIPQSPISAKRMRQDNDVAIPGSFETVGDVFAVADLQVTYHGP